MGKQHLSRDERLIMKGKLQGTQECMDMVAMALMDKCGWHIQEQTEDSRDTHSIAYLYECLEKITIEQATAHLREAGIPDWRFWCYVLVQDVEESHKRILALRDMGVEPFAQPYRDYDGGEPTAEQKRLARWVNMRAAFQSCSFEEFTG